MLRLLQFLLVGHFHTWEEDERTTLVDDNFPIGKVSFCHCTKCGVRRAFSMRA